MIFLKAFLVGGLICVIGQLLINFTKITNGKILVLFLILGCILEGFGLYEPLINFAGAGATVPISGFGSVLVKGAYDAIKNDGLFGLFKGGLSAAAAGVSVAIFFGYIVALIFKPRTKRK
ncbi:MAG: stage V sporulation protein AE [Clostridia bacterium]